MNFVFFRAKRAFCINVLILFSVLFFGQLSFAQDETPSVFSDKEIDFLKEHPFLNVACDPSRAPFEYQDSINAYPQIQGINISILKKIAEKLGVTFQFIPTKTFEESLFLLNSSKVDIVSGNSSSVKDNPSLSFSDAAYKVDVVLISQLENPDEKNIAVCNIFGDELLNLKKIFPGEQDSFVQCSSAREVLTLFKSKKISRAVVNYFDAELYFSSQDFKKQTLGIEYTQRFIFKPASDELQSIINKGISLISADEMSRSIYEDMASFKYYNLEKQTTSIYLKRAIMYILFVMVILAIITAILITLAVKKKIHVIEYDEITGMPTPVKFKHEVRKVLRHAKPDEYMIISLDVNDFKFINDSFGYSKGNLILVELSNHFIQNKYKDELICRYNADNFVFFTKKMEFIFVEDHVYNLTSVNKKLNQFLPEKYNLTFSASVYYIDDTKQDVTLMIDKANMARKISRQSFATQRVIEYTKEMNDKIEWNKEVTLNMNDAFANKQFKVYYQPKYSFDTETIMGAEALIRWKDPQKGILSPDSFVPLFERNGFIQKIDMYVFDSVCRFLSEWKEASPDGTCPHPLTISFNLSRNHLYNPDLIKELCSIKDKYDIGPNHVEVELTESIMFDNQKRLISVMNQIKNAGYSISVDDFGSGYSSLNLLKDIPADVLKLDKEFLSNVPENSKETTIISSVIEMSKKLNLKIVAEGVENKSQAQLLREMGCDIAQGYYYAKPITEEEYRKLLEKDFIGK